MRIGSCQCFLTKNVQRRCCPQPLPERGACGVGTLAVEKVDPAPVALVAVQGAQAVAVQRFLKKEKQPGIVRFQAASDAGGGGRTHTCY